MARGISHELPAPVLPPRVGDISTRPTITRDVEPPQPLPGTAELYISTCPTITRDVERSIHRTRRDKTRELKVFVYAIGNVEDHIHLAISIPPPSPLPSASATSKTQSHPSSTGNTPGSTSPGRPDTAHSPSATATNRLWSTARATRSAIIAPERRFPPLSAPPTTKTRSARQSAPPTARDRSRQRGARGRARHPLPPIVRGFNPWRARFTPLSSLSSTR